MTRSLSNLYKQRFTVARNDSTRIINSNSKIEARMQELEQQFMPVGAQAGVDGFIAGLQVEEVEAVPKEETVIRPEEALQKAQEEAEATLAAASQQAEGILEEAKEQAKGLLAQAKQEGYNAGLAEGEAKAQTALEQRMQELEAERSQFEEDYRQKVEELEPYLVDIVADVFEKVFHVQFDDQKEILLYLIERVVLNAEGTKDFQVRVSLKDYEFVDAQKDEIVKRVGDAVNVEIMADAALKERQCMIETDSGVFDCGLDVQLGHLVKALRALSL